MLLFNNEHERYLFVGERHSWLAYLRFNLSPRYCTCYAERLYNAEIRSHCTSKIYHFDNDFLTFNIFPIYNDVVKDEFESLINIPIYSILNRAKIQRLVLYVSRYSKEMYRMYNDLFARCQRSVEDIQEIIDK